MIGALMWRLPTECRPKFQLIKPVGHNQLPYHSYLINLFGKAFKCQIIVKGA